MGLNIEIDQQKCDLQAYDTEKRIRVAVRRSIRLPELKYNYII